MIAMLYGVTANDREGRDDPFEEFPDWMVILLDTFRTSFGDASVQDTSLWADTENPSKSTFCMQ